jgi:hypothetical protein
MKADDAAAAALLLGAQKRGGIRQRRGRIREQGRVVIVEDEYTFIARR